MIRGCFSRCPSVLHMLLGCELQWCCLHVGCCRIVNNKHCTIIRILY